MRRIICEYLSLACVLVVLIHGGEAHHHLKPKIKIERVTDAYGLSEGPHWDSDAQKLYFVDIYNQYVRRLDPATGVVTSTYIDHGPVSVVVPVHDSPNKLVVGSGKDVILVNWNSDANQKVTPYNVLSNLTSGDVRTNDGKADSAGRLWIGTMANEINGQIALDKGSLYRLDDTLKPKTEITPVSISNGLAWNIEDNTFYYIDSSTREIAAYDFDPNSGTISNKRIVLNLNHTKLEGVPDGMTIDTDGNLWVALFGGHGLIKVDPHKHKVLEKIELPARDVSSVAFGGPLLDILYVTTSGHGLTAEERKKTPYAGSVFAIHNLGVHGILANTFLFNKVDESLDEEKIIEEKDM
ncbi:regucalcin isoform X1 [Camponotus floridanus]|uniref:regucalcin isoform X1 n=1 Tax=Camponotus floridanus TaxID=104421 RepID=UPI000DC6B69B|nr:regucalcin isoform X1 [Camponotus floridanus]